MLATCWAGIILGTSPAAATTAVQLDLEGLVANSNRIVVGDVAEVESFRRDGRILTDVTLEIEHNWKGEGPGVVTIRQPGGRIGDIVTHVPGTPTFETGQRVVLFLEPKDNPDVCVTTGLSQGAFQIVTGPDGATQFVVPQLADLNLVAPTDETDETSSAGGNEIPSNGSASSEIRRQKTRLEPADTADIHESTTSLEAFRQRVQSTVRAQESAP